MEAAAAVSPLASGVKKATLARGLPQPLPRQSSVWQIALDRSAGQRGDWPAVATTETYPRATRRELASYGIKLPSQRAAEKKPVKPSAISTIPAISTTMINRCDAAG